MPIFKPCRLFTPPTAESFDWSECMRNIVAAVAAVTLSALTMPCAYAHHAFAAEFDANQPITLRGVVTKVELINPHSWLYIDVKDGATGKTVPWKIEMGAPNALMRRGWNKSSLPAGT